jgi:hypothetical protein
MLLISLKRAITLVAIRGDGGGGESDRHYIRATAIVAEPSKNTKKVYNVFFAMTGSGADVIRHLIATPRKSIGDFMGSMRGSPEELRAALFGLDNLTPVRVEISDTNIDVAADYQAGD